MKDASVKLTYKKKMYIDIDMSDCQKNTHNNTWGHI